jgi:hypothetical protein
LHEPCHVAYAKKEFAIIGHWNHCVEQGLASHVSLQMHQQTCLLGRPPAVLGLHGLSPAVFVVSEIFGTVEDNEYLGFDNHILPNAGVD